jgi:hypothetical protein
MKLKTKIIALLALASSALVIPANAAVTFTQGDLILAVRSAVEGKTYMVNLGAATGYRDATANITNIVNIDADLDANFAGWETRDNVYWSLFGVRDSDPVGGVVAGDPGQTIYVSRAQTTLGTQRPAFNAPSGTNHGNAATNMSGVQVLFANGTPTGLANATVLLDSPTGYNATSTATWAAFTATGGTVASNASGIDNTALDLFRSLGNTTGASPTGTLRVGSYEGTFRISDTGIVSYSTTPAVGVIPEPSRALLLGLGAVGFIFRRRRTAVQA